MTVLAGIDIGGSKCAVCLGSQDGERISVIAKRRVATPPTPQATLDWLGSSLQALLEESGRRLLAIGVSCGGPLDSRRGLILSPPNLPGWDAIDVVTPFAERFGVPVALQNDANAGALAEWRWGAGRGCRNMVFLTFGTGMGAGLILDGKLYTGTNDMAGEVGHIRLDDDGPLGYGKAGSFEGFCSGGGIAQLARSLAIQAMQEGEPPLYCPTPAALDGITTEKVGLAAQEGDVTALQVFDIVARQLGRGLSVLVDILNPERIIMGSIWLRQRPLLQPATLATLRAEALARSLSVCEVAPAGLGESVGDLAGLSVALQALAG